MATRMDIPSVDAVNLCGNENSLFYLMGVLCGCPVVVDSDNNPFLKRPEDLTENVWHLLRSDQSRHSEAVVWKPRGEDRQIVLDQPISCWEITREFHETNNQNTNWMMLEYKITVANESFSVCRTWQEPAPHLQVGNSIPSDNNHQHSADDCPVEGQPDVDTFTSGDYLELRDLEVPLFPSSSLDGQS